MIQVGLRGVDADTWKDLRLEAVRRGVHIGQLLNQIVADWLKKNQTK